jgi:two-component system chemotaxis response regulator CheY
MDDIEIIQEFIIESTELLENAEHDLVSLEKSFDLESFNRIFRALHTIKGNSAMLGFKNVSALAHQIEDWVDWFRSQHLQPTKAMTDVFFKTFDYFKTYFASIREFGHDRSEIPDFEQTMALADQLLGAESKELSAKPDIPGNYQGKFLIVEDDLVAREIMLGILSVHGSCDIAEDGRQAIKYMKNYFDGMQHHPPYDLITMDIMMPYMDGLESVKKIREMEMEHGIFGNKEIPIIMTTVLDDPKTVINAFYHSGATSYLVKPIFENRLLHELSKLGLLF